MASFSEKLIFFQSPKLYNTAGWATGNFTVNLNTPLQRYCSVIKSRQELRENQAYLLQILEAERKAKLQYLQQTDELEAEIVKLKNELNALSPAKPTKTP
uniref:Orphan protein n=1 Tax=Mesocestoides corti TaxID=53468 RepID=A0A5K3FN79_MESCO